MVTSLIDAWLDSFVGLCHCDSPSFRNPVLKNVGFLNMSASSEFAVGLCWTMLDLVSSCFPGLPGGCIATVQALSGTGSLQCIAQFLKFMGVTKARFHGRDSETLMS
jgi:hypothetical protein